jgi:hypothetical protein
MLRLLILPWRKAAPALRIRQRAITQSAQNDQSYIHFATLARFALFALSANYKFSA